ncbi:hypothetical protein ACNR9Q_02800 [Maribacter sp. X9]|uniref:hypothetical protein n=1 Tax=Maribacter sp. X9 TaxID=3402159 RepID=UPI003AF3ADB1
MKKLKERFFTSKFVALFILICLSGCGATQTHYQKEYAKVWKELIKTKAWKESLVAARNSTTDELYASADNEVVLVEDSKMEAGFEDKYQSLVSRAYFRIITEAEKADARISAEYKLLQEGDVSSRESKKKVAEITKKYEAHKAMLSGLKSWNIFSEDRSGDLKYFKAENEEAVQKMMGANESENQMVNYLIYKLADLYHVEEN